MGVLLRYGHRYPASYLPGMRGQASRKPGSVELAIGTMAQATYGSLYPIPFSERSTLEFTWRRVAYHRLHRITANTTNAIGRLSNVLVLI